MPWIVEHPDGDVSQHEAAPGTQGISEGVRFDATPRQLDLTCEQWDWASAAIVPLLEVYRERLLASVELARRAAGEAALSEGRSVQYAYREKAAELRAWDAAAPEARVPADYPWLSAEATATGETIEAVADRVRSAKVLADTALRTVEAKAQAAKIAIRAATTVEDMQAAAAVDWEN